MFRIKICGVTTMEDARAVADSAADALGLNFYRASPRHCDPDAALRISREMEGEVQRVGVFVNMPFEAVEYLRTSLPLDYVQLHGDESAEYARQFPEGTVIRALRFDADASVDALAGWLDEAGKPWPWLAGLLIDAYQGGQYGGTGKVADWPAVQALRRRVSPCRVVLAGGLTPENIREAVESAEPDGVDTASGVERVPGRKDRSSVLQFAYEADQALQRLGR